MECCRQSWSAQMVCVSWRRRLSKLSFLGTLHSSNITKLDMLQVHKLGVKGHVIIFKKNLSTGYYSPSTIRKMRRTNMQRKNNSVELRERRVYVFLRSRLDLKPYTRSPKFVQVCMGILSDSAHTRTFRQCLILKKPRYNHFYKTCVATSFYNHVCHKRVALRFIRMLDIWVLMMLTSWHATPVLQSRKKKVLK